MDAQLKAIQIVILIFSVILHEVMHGVVARKFGDRTAEQAGRITLNPLPHIDLIGTILVPIFFLITTNFMLGWAKPVPVNPLNFTNIRRGEFMVSAAGIMANFGLAIIAAILFHIFQAVPMQQELISRALFYAVFINLLLGLFNLLPIPPLDGSKMLISQLSYRLAKEYQKIERYGFLLILIMLVSGSFQFVYAGAIFLTRALLGNF